MVTPNIANINLFVSGLKNNGTVQKRFKIIIKDYVGRGGVAIDIDEDMMIEDAMNFRDNIAMAIENTIGHLYELSVKQVKREESNGKLHYEYDITISPSDLERDSLYSYGYETGVYDIIGLFTHGYDAGGKHVYGRWHGKYTRSLSERAGSRFMQNVADEINLELKRKYNNKGVSAFAYTMYDDFLIDD